MRKTTYRKTTTSPRETTEIKKDVTTVITKTKNYSVYKKKNVNQKKIKEIATTPQTTTAPTKKIYL